jgi:hypothetical protein
MHPRILLIWLTMLPCLAAQDDTITPDQPVGNLARLARKVAGPGSGNDLFYLPTRDEPATPANWGFNYETVNFNSLDGTALHGWFIPARGTHARGTVVFSHGNAGSLGHHLGFVIWLAEAGYHVLMYDYRGFGKSGGDVDRRGMINDVKAAFAHAAGRPKVNANRMVSYGHSLGGAKSVTALGESRVRGLRAVIIDGAFASYRAMAGVVGGQLGESLVTDELSPLDYVRKISPVPLLVVHGARDPVVPVAQGRELYRAAGEPKTLFEVKEAGHGDALARDGGAYRKRVLAWLAETLDG